MYGSGISRPDHLTTALRYEARDGAELLEKTASFIEKSLPTIVNELVRLRDEVGNHDATKYITDIETALAHLGAAAVNTLGKP